MSDAHVTRRVLHRLWADRRIGFAVVVVLAAGWGGIVGWWTPRGPLTSGEALWSITIGLLVGVLAGLATRSRWAMLVAPLSFVIAVELTRLDATGPTVDAPRLSAYGVLAFLSGRGFHALLALVPMALGGSLGAALGRRLAPAPPADEPDRAGWRTARRIAAGLTAVVLVLLSAGIARPASTAPIADAEGRRVPGSIAELTTVEVGGHELTLMIRGHSHDNPVMLFLAGGPGGSELGAMRRHLPALEEHVTVVTLEQRGAGSSAQELDPTSTLTLEAAITDTIAVTDHLRDRFGQDRIYLLGQSWGTTLGVLAVQRAPDRYVAFIGTGQMVSQVETDRIFYDDTLEWARREGRAGLVDDLERIGPPPYDEMFAYELALSHEQQVHPYDRSPNSEGAGQMSENLLVREYSLVHQVRLLGAFMDTFSVLYPQLQDIDFRRTATEFEIPMFFVQGAHEAPGRARLFEEWYPMIDAPITDLAVFETSGHRPLWEQPDEFVEYVVGTVLELAPPSRATRETSTTTSTTTTTTKAAPDTTVAPTAPLSD